MSLPSRDAHCRPCTHTGCDSCRQHGFQSFRRMQQFFFFLKKILYYNNNNMNLSLVLCFCFSISFRDWGGKEQKSVIHLSGPEQRELLCGLVPPPAVSGGWAIPLKGHREGPVLENWLQSETFQGFPSRRIRSHG